MYWTATVFPQLLELLSAQTLLATSCQGQHPSHAGHEAHTMEVEYWLADKNVPLYRDNSWLEPLGKGRTGKGYVRWGHVYLLYGNHNRSTHNGSTFHLPCKLLHPSLHLHGVHKLNFSSHTKLANISSEIAKFINLNTLILKDFSTNNYGTCLRGTCNVLAFNYILSSPGITLSSLDAYLLFGDCK